MDDDTRRFLDLPVRLLEVRDGALAYRETGEGPPLLLVHGWPLWGFTWRRMLPRLAEAHRCVVVDLLGTGQSRWSAKTDVSMSAQAEALAQLLETLEIERAGVVAHDSGATIARQLALIAPQRVGRLVLMGTEIPNHHPKLVLLFQAVAGMPGGSALFGLAMRSKAFVSSNIGFGGCFADRRLIGGDFGAHVVEPLARDARVREGQLAYARAIDWALVDSLAEGHRRIHQPTLLLWGERDPYFPVELARPMADQFPDARFETLPGKLFIHEEHPERIARRALEFFRDERATSAVRSS